MISLGIFMEIDDSLGIFMESDPGTLAKGGIHGHYPLVICYIAIGNCPFLVRLWLIYLLKMVIFHGYVGFPGGTSFKILGKPTLYVDIIH